MGEVCGEGVWVCGCVGEVCTCTSLKSVFSSSSPPGEKVALKHNAVLSKRT